MRPTSCIPIFNNFSVFADSAATLSFSPEFRHGALMQAAGNAAVSRRPPAGTMNAVPHHRRRSESGSRRKPGPKHGWERNQTSAQPRSMNRVRASQYFSCCAFQRTAGASSWPAGGRVCGLLCPYMHFGAGGKPAPSFQVRNNPSLEPSPIEDVPVHPFSHLSPLISPVDLDIG